MHWLVGWELYLEMNAKLVCSYSISFCISLYLLS